MTKIIFLELKWLYKIKPLIYLFHFSKTIRSLNLIFGNKFLFTFKKINSFYNIKKALFLQIEKGTWKMRCKKYFFTIFYYFLNLSATKSAFVPPE
jgi:hypothetical protein